MEKSGKFAWRFNETSLWNKLEMDVHINILRFSNRYNVTNFVQPYSKNDSTMTPSQPPS